VLDDPALDDPVLDDPALDDPVLDASAAAADALAAVDGAEAAAELDPLPEEQAVTANNPAVPQASSAEATPARFCVTFVDMCSTPWGFWGIRPFRRRA
jgi:hypothetical protein